MQETLALSLFFLTLLFVILRPKGIGIGWSAWIGALLCLSFGLVSLQDVFYITSLVWDATLAFVFLIFISIILDKAGLFEWMAIRAMGYARGNGTLLFLLLMLLGAFISAVFTNDGASLMLTPIIYSKIKHLNLPKTAILPYIMGSGFIADTASLPFVISNLTNIITAHFFGIDFWRYALLMAFPNLVSVFSSILVLYFFYRRQMLMRYDPEILEIFPPKYAVKDPFIFWTGWFAILFMGVSFLLLELLKVNLPFSVILGLCALLLSFASLKNRVVSLKDTLRFTPWHIILFSVGMYAVVYSLKNAGFTRLLVESIQELRKLEDFYAILGTGLLSAILSAMMNNLPTVMMLNIAIGDGGLPHELTQFLALANLAGTNIGPKLTPIGSLATLLWLHILEHRKIHISWKYYVGVGVILTFPVLLATLLALCLVYAVIILT